MPSTPKPNLHNRNWLELPYDVMANIVYKVGVLNILENAQKVCTSWHKICKDPAMWRVIYMDPAMWRDMHSDILGLAVHDTPKGVVEMCKNAVNRSQGQLVDMSISEFANCKLLYYVANRSSKLRRLEILRCNEHTYRSWTKVLKKFPLLEELSIFITDFPKEAIETLGRYCPMLKTLKLNQEPLRGWRRDDCFEEEFLRSRDEIAIAVGENLPELKHLELIGNCMSNNGLEVILKGCRHLESLDLRLCMFINLKADLGKICLEKIKCLKLPNDSLEGCPYRTCFNDYDDMVPYLFDLID